MCKTIFVSFWWSFLGTVFVPLPARTLSLPPPIGLPHHERLFQRLQSRKESDDADLDSAFQSKGCTSCEQEVPFSHPTYTTRRHVSNPPRFAIFELLQLLEQFENIF